ncbi:MAG TPA: hypothetical protein PLV07_13385 [Acidiphilium sp.]|nr:hypothetical protein [Acidiphilium sp.]
MTDLSDKMRALAETGHPRGGELREKADAFDVAAKGFYSAPQTVNVKSFMGAWARARRLWCDCTEEPLI